MNQEPGKNQRRFGEILRVLRKHHVTKGIDPVKLCLILEDLGPTYIKLGQMMSMRSDILPERYCKDLARLRTNVKPMSFDMILEVLDQFLPTAKEKIFAEIDPEPLGSASIAQVYRAVLKNGENVVLKIQRPGIKETMAEDIALLQKASGLLNFAAGTGDLIDFRSVIQELWETTKEEMDFIKEADHLELFYKNQETIRYVDCPKVFREYSSEKLLVMSYMEGIRIDQVALLEESGYDMVEIGQKTAENYCKQILEDGFFHADPHPGNLWICGGKISWLDLGMTGHLTDQYKAVLKRAISAILKNDIYELKNAFLSFGNPKRSINHAQLYTDLDDMVGRYMNVDFGSMNLGDLLEDTLDLLKKHEIGVASDVTLLARSMVTMEGTLKTCSPQVNMMQILATHMSSVIWNDFDLKKELRHSLLSIYGSSKKSLEIPAQMSDLLNITKNGQIRINVEASDARELKVQVQNHVNQITITILAAVFWFSSAILCLTDLQPKIWGIPWLAFGGFVIGTVFILWLLIRMLIWKRKL